MPMWSGEGPPLGHRLPFYLNMVEWATALSKISFMCMILLKSHPWGLCHHDLIPPKALFITPSTFTFGDTKIMAVFFNLLIIVVLFCISLNTNTFSSSYIQSFWDAVFEKFLFKTLSKLAMLFLFWLLCRRLLLYFSHSCRGDSPQFQDLMQRSLLHLLILWFGKQLALSSVVVLLAGLSRAFSVQNSSAVLL